MGLDQYAYAVMPHPENTDLSFEKFDDNGNESYRMISQWRKHPNLQGWMEKLYESKGGEGSFNCSPVRVTFQDLKDLKETVLDSELPVTSGFFFGESRPEDRDADLKFIEDAMKAISQDMEIYYDSWW